jgi:hypothetical protein
LPDRESEKSEGATTTAKNKIKGFFAPLRMTNVFLTFRELFFGR